MLYLCPDCIVKAATERGFKQGIVYSKKIQKQRSILHFWAMAVAKCKKHKIFNCYSKCLYIIALDRHLFYF